MKIHTIPRFANHWFRWFAAILLASSPAALCADSAAPSPTLADHGWPREITRNKVKIACYPPQIDEWMNYRLLKARFAVALTPPGEPPALGVAEISGETTTDSSSRTVVVRNIKIDAARFHTDKPEDTTRLEAILKQAFPTDTLTVSLDRLLAGVRLSKDSSAAVEVKMDPPPIFVSTAPAMVLMVEGKPVLSPAEKTGLKFVVNTNWDLFLDEAAGNYYLLSGDEWLSAKDLAGPWELASSVPPSLETLPDDDTWKHVKDEIPWKIQKGMVVPKVFYSDKPAELITFKGDPVWERVENTSLEWAENSESHVFRQQTSGTIYFLVSGRWFKAPKLGEAWVYAGNDLPEDFRNIPADAPCAEVLSSVPGTIQAEDAVILASVPVEAVVSIKEAEAKAKAEYQGDPEFKPIDGTKLQYAANTESDVILCDGKYYLCQDAVWFVSAAAGGPWTVCKDVPDEIYTIPAASPVYRVTYVNVEKNDDNDDDHVVCSYTSGYFGAFVAGMVLGDCLVWGTGYYYPPMSHGDPIPTIIRIPIVMGWRRPTIPGPEVTLSAHASMVPMPPQVAPRGTIPPPDVTVAPHGWKDRMAHAPSPEPTIRGPARVGQRARATTDTPSGALPSPAAVTTGSARPTWPLRTAESWRGAVPMAVAGSAGATKATVVSPCTTVISTRATMATFIARMTGNGANGRTAAGNLRGTTPMESIGPIVRTTARMIALTVPPTCLATVRTTATATDSFPDKPGALPEPGPAPMAAASRDSFPTTASVKAGPASAVNFPTTVWEKAEPASAARFRSVR